MIKIDYLLKAVRFLLSFIPFFVFINTFLFFFPDIKRKKANKYLEHKLRQTKRKTESFFQELLTNSQHTYTQTKSLNFKDINHKKE